MKRILFALLALSVFGFSSPNVESVLNIVDTVPTGVPQVNNFPYVQFKGYVRVDSALLMQDRDTNFIPIKPSLVIRSADSSLYLYNKRKWVKVSGAVSVAEIDPSVSAVAKTISGTDTSNWNNASRKRITAMAYDSASQNLTTSFFDGTTIVTNLNVPISSGADGNNYPTSLTYSTISGVLTLSRNGLSSLTVTIPVSGETNTGANMGVGSQIFQTKVGAELRFRTLQSTNGNITVSQGTNEVNLTGKSFVDSLRRKVASDSVFQYIGGVSTFAFKDSSAPAASGEVNTASNVGTGSQLYKTKVGVDLQFRTITTDTTIIKTTNTDDVELKVDQTRVASVPRLRDSVALRVRYSDTSLMLTPYLRKFDTTAMLSKYLRKSDTVPRFNPIAGTNVTLSGTYPNITFNATGGSGSTDLGTTRNTNSISITSSTGADITLDSATASLAGPLSAYRYRQLDTLIAGDSVFLRKKFGTDSVYFYIKPFPYTTTDSSYAFVDVSGGAASTVKKAFYYASDYGIYPDNTDITQKLKTLDSVMQVNGGGILIFDSACGNSRAYRIDGRFQLAHNGALVPYQSPRKWQGLGATRRGAGSYNLRGATVLDLRFTADSNSAQIDTRGIGSFEMTDMDLVHTVDVNRTRFFHTTSTVPVHRNLYVKGFNSGSGANEDFAIWGGKNGGGIDSTYNSPFQAYGAILENCVFDGIQSGVIMQRYCNNNWVRDNNFWNTCGGLAAIIINSYDNAQGDVGNVIEGNLIQTNSYTYAIDVSGGQNNTFIANSSFDGGAGLVSVINLRANSEFNVVHAGKGESSKPYVNTSSLGTNWFYPSEQNGKNNFPFGFKTNGTVSEFATASARVKNSANNDSHFFETGGNSVDLRFSDNNGSDDYIASFQYFGAAVNKLRLIGTSYGGVYADADLRLQSGNNTVWFNDQAYMLNQTLYSNADGIPAFRMRNTGQISFSGTTSATGSETILQRDSIGQLSITDGASTYKNLKLNKYLATGASGYTTSQTANYNALSWVTKTDLDAVALPTQTGNADKTLTTNGTTASWGLVITQGTNTPTLTNQTNIAASTAYPLQWYRIGDNVTFYGEVDLDPTATGAFELRLSLPVASTFSATTEVGGTGATAGINEAVEITAVVGGSTIAIKGNATDIANRKVKIHGTYKIVIP